MALPLIISDPALGYPAGFTIGDIEPNGWIGDQPGAAIGETFAAQTATGSTAILDVGQQLPSKHVAQLVLTGSPTAVTYSLDGSLDGVNFTSLTGPIALSSGSWTINAAAAQGSATTVLAFAPDNPVSFIRGTLSVLTGGTSPTVTLTYQGSR